ncbi:MAG: DUF488 family protein [Verrucomicrobiota bacterium]
MKNKQFDYVMISICVIQHVAAEPPGLIAEVLKANGIALNFVRPFRGETVPTRLGDHSGLVVMGGPMGVYEQDQFPFLRREIRLIQDAVNRQRPVLGVCLGSQLLAAALGASVTPGQRKEIGWHPVTLSRAAARDSLLHDLPESFTAFHWHGDVFQLPAKATSLAWSNLTEHQAFHFGESAYGFLFHLEVTEPLVKRMTRIFRAEMRQAGVSAESVLTGVPQHLLRLQDIGRAVFGRWAALVNGQSSATTTPTLRAKRVYEPSAPDDGARFLVDRLWPRGVRKDSLRLDGWLKGLAPSDALRRWFGHDPVRWPEFRRRYFAELEGRSELLQPIRDALARGPVTLLFSAADAQHNNAVALIEYCQSEGISSGK